MSIFNFQMNLKFQFYLDIKTNTLLRSPADARGHSSCMDNSFYFSLARISTAQILRAAGLDRTRPSTLDAITDIMIRYLNLLATQAKFFAELSSRSECHIRDVRLAMEDIGIIQRGRLISRKKLKKIERYRNEYSDEDEDEDEDEEDNDPDGEDEYDESYESLELLLVWFKGSQAAECRRVAGVGGTNVTIDIATTTVTNGTSTIDNQKPSFVAEYVSCMCLLFSFLILALIQKELGKVSVEKATNIPHDGGMHPVSTLMIAETTT